MQIENENINRIKLRQSTMSNETTITLSSIECWSILVRTLLSVNLNETLLQTF